MPGISADLGLPWRWLCYGLHSFTKPVEMRPVGPAWGTHEEYMGSPTRLPTEEMP